MPAVKRAANKESVKKEMIAVLQGPATVNGKKQEVLDELSLKVHPTNVRQASRALVVLKEIRANPKISITKARASTLSRELRELKSSLKSSAKKASAKKGSAKKGSAKKGSAKKGSAKKASAKKASAKKASAKKASAKKASAKKGSAKKGSAKKGSAKKGSAKKSVDLNCSYSHAVSEHLKNQQRVNKNYNVVQARAFVSALWETKKVEQGCNTKKISAKKGSAK